MGIFSGKDHFFSSKYITAEIKDEQKRKHLVPIKYTIGDFFLAKINGLLYVFKIDHDEIYTQFDKWTKSIKTLDYTTKHYAPMSAEHCKELELIIKKNGLPHIDRIMFNMLELLGRTEGKKFKPHRLNFLKKLMGERDDQHAANVRDIATFLQDLTVDEIVTPVKEITQYLEKSFIATDPQFIASVGENMVRAEVEKRRITNTPMGAKKSYAKLILIIMIIGGIGTALYFVVPMAMHGGLPFQNMFAPPPKADIASKYATPEAAKAAIDRGEVKLSDFSATYQGYINNVKPPQAQEKIIQLTP